jgi:1,4-dihydroxy-6-naphthoate synthase
MIIAHTPDADDAFMFYGLLSGKIAANFEITPIVEDIETLNRRAFNTEIDVTALSAHAYAFLHSQYRILSAGASVGDGYGPVVVARREMDVEGKRIAVPGKYTTANLLLKLAVGDFQPVEMRFDEVIPAVKRGEVDAGLVIHEAQITYPQHGLAKIIDLWEWWHEKTGLPLPLGINAIKRDIPLETQHEFLAVMRKSVQYALDNVEEALQYAMKYARGADKELVKKFALMYVNKSTYEMGEDVVKALDELYRMAERKGFLESPPLDILFL